MIIIVADERIGLAAHKDGFKRFALDGRSGYNAQWAGQGGWRTANEAVSRVLRWEIPPDFGSLVLDLNERIPPR